MAIKTKITNCDILLNIKYILLYYYNIFSFEDNEN